MIVLPDSSVWIDSLRHASTSANRFIAQRDEHEELATAGVIAQEVLEGIREDSDYEKMRGRLWGMLILEPQALSTYELAAQLHRRARRQGLTIRKANDCLIAALALEHGALLLHNDRDFFHLAQVEPALMIYPGLPH
jgi:predicted nucleic acid-binding protein